MAFQMEQLPVKVIQSKRKTISIEIKEEAVIVRTPKGMSRQEINDFLELKKSWIEKHWNIVQERKKKTEELIKKLERLTNKYEASQFQREVYIYNRAKAQNETIFYNVDYIHDAINSNVQIQFQYSEWTVKKELQLKKDGAFYVVSPWALTWADENYYLIAYDEKADKIKHYRVDKMKSMSLLQEKRLGRAQFDRFDLADFSKKTFGMYGGEDAKITLEGINGLAGVVIDRFGQDVAMMAADDEHFRAIVTVAVSQQFFGWLSGLGAGIRIVSPDGVRTRYKEFLEKLLNNYQE